MPDMTYQMTLYRNKQERPKEHSASIYIGPLSARQDSCQADDGRRMLPGEASQRAATKPNKGQTTEET